MDTFRSSVVACFRLILTLLVINTFAHGAQGDDPGGETSLGAGRAFFLSTVSACNDNNSGRSRSDPWCTVARLNQQTLAAGDTVLFERNSKFVSAVGIHFRFSGDTEHPIVYGAYGTEGSRPSVLAPWAKDNATGQTFVNISNVIVDRLSLEAPPNVAGTSIRIQGSENITIRNSRIRGLTSACLSPQAGSRDIFIRNNQIRDCGPTSGLPKKCDVCGLTSNGECIYITRDQDLHPDDFTDNVQVIGNEITACGDEAVNIKGGSRNTLVTGNHIHGLTMFSDPGAINARQVENDGANILIECNIVENISNGEPRAAGTCDAEAFDACARIGTRGATGIITSNHGVVVRDNVIRDVDHHCIRVDLSGESASDASARMTFLDSNSCTNNGRDPDIFFQL